MAPKSPPRRVSPPRLHQAVQRAANRREDGVVDRCAVAWLNSRMPRSSKLTISRSRPGPVGTLREMWTEQMVAADRTTTTPSTNRSTAARMRGIDLSRSEQASKKRAVVVGLSPAAEYSGREASGRKAAPSARSVRREMPPIPSAITWWKTNTSAMGRPNDSEDALVTTVADQRGRDRGSGVFTARAAISSTASSSFAQGHSTIDTCSARRKSRSSIQIGRPHPNGTLTSNWCSRGTVAILAPKDSRARSRSKSSGIQEHHGTRLHRVGCAVAHEAHEIVGAHSIDRRVTAHGVPAVADNSPMCT